MLYKLTLKNSKKIKC